MGLNNDIKHRFGSSAVFEMGAWRPWLDAHLNRELGVGALSRGWRDPPSLVTIDVLLEELGQPQRRYESILIGGTNGKTTVTRTASTLLHAVGLRVGTFTSPHLDRLNERIVIDGEPVTDQVLARLFARIAAIEARMSLALSWFEIMTAAAMMWFASREVDVAVIEVGLGGENDATAVVMPALVTLTNIDLDHTEFFGDSRPDVASAEAAIITAGYGLVLGESDPSLRGCFTRRLPHPLWIRDVDFGVSKRVVTPGGQVLALKTASASYADVTTRLRGRQHAENISIALMAAECVAGPLPELAVRHVLSDLRAPGRLELVCSEPRVLVDGAHNPAGARALAENLSESFPGGRRTFVIGTSADKPAREIVTALEIRTSDQVVCCSADSPRALPAADLVEIVHAVSPLTAVQAARGVRDAVHRAVDAIPRSDLIVITGSLYVVAEARQVFRDLIRP